MVEHIVDGAGVVALKHIEVDDIFAHINFFAHLNHLEFTIFVENDNVVDVGAIAHKFIFLQPRANKAIGTIDVEFFVGFRHLRRHNGVEVADNGAARIGATVFLFQALIPFDGVVHQVGKFLVNVGDALIKHGNVVVCLIDIEFQNSCHFNFQQSEQIVAGDEAHKLRLVGLQTLIDVCQGSVQVFGLLIGAVFIDAFFDKDFLERCIE